MQEEEARKYSINARGEMKNSIRVGEGPDGHERKEAIDARVKQLGLEKLNNGVMEYISREL